MIDIKDKTTCCGCCACYNICPNKAITMEIDEYGFKYPKINKEKCINCGLCEKVCPILNNQKERLHDIDVYAIYNKDKEQRRKSSSGGIFILIAKEIIRRNGVVFGAAFDEQFNLYHTYVEKEEDLEKFMKSKYLQSDINDTYRKVKELLSEGRYVLFTGTPCQIEGLKKYLMKDYDKLYTQDIICHGVPSPKVWNLYKKYRMEQDGAKPTCIDFRNKKPNWNLYSLLFKYKDKEYIKNYKEDLYMKSFLRNTCLRDSCYNCNFKKKYRISDITLADFWAIEKVHPDMFDNKGTSAILINSNKGKELFNAIKDKCEYKKSKLEYIEKYNSSYIKSAKTDSNREKFFSNLDRLKFDKLVNKYTYRPNLYKKIINKLKKVLKLK